MTTLSELHDLLEKEDHHLPWHLDHDSDLTIDGKSTPKLIGCDEDSHFLVFARGNRNYEGRARLAAAAVNALPALLEVAEAARRLDELLYGPNEDRTATQHMQIKVRLERELHESVNRLDSPNVKEGGK